MGRRPEIEGPLTGGGGVSLISDRSLRVLNANGFIEEEFIVSGTAASYRPAAALGRDGRWDVVEDDLAAFRTRVVVRRPVEAAAFNGTVVVEWHNVSAGIDTAPDWTYLAAEILRRGYAWVGVSAQRVGVVGGASTVGLPDSGGLVGIDPERYGSLVHPGDAFSYDIYTQVASAMRDGGAVIGGFEPERIIAIGESQSAFRLTTYVNAVQPLAGAFDGFLIHSRAGVGAGLGEWTRGTDDPSPTVIVRTDLSSFVPVLVVESETDVGPVFGYYASRQPDSDRFRLWEVAGTAHADAFQLGGNTDAFGCTHLVNDGPQHLVVKAALRHLDTWVRDGVAPPSAPRLTATPTPAIVRDGFGNALGGVRTPLVDVPSSVLSGEPAGCGGELCWLFGSTDLFERDQLVELYGDATAYRAAFAQSADDAIAAGFILADDRLALDTIAADVEKRFA